MRTEHKENTRQITSNTRPQDKKHNTAQDNTHDKSTRRNTRQDNKRRENTNQHIGLLMWIENVSLDFFLLQMLEVGIFIKADKIRQNMTRTRQNKTKQKKSAWVCVCSPTWGSLNTNKVLLLFIIGSRDINF